MPQGWLVLLGRLLYVVIFLNAAYTQSTNFAGTRGYMSAVMPGLSDGLLGFLLVGALSFMIVGGLGVLLGACTRFSAVLAVIFLVIVTPIFHAFWAAPPDQAQLQLLQFEKNLGMLGGALWLLAYGPGPLSLDAWWRSRRGGPADGA
jgi:putative oxidoreductase